MQPLPSPNHKDQDGHICHEPTPDSVDPLLESEDEENTWRDTARGRRGWTRRSIWPSATTMRWLLETVLLLVILGLLLDRRWRKPFSLEAGGDVTGFAPRSKLWTRRNTLVLSLLTCQQYRTRSSPLFRIRCLFPRTGRNSSQMRYSPSGWASFQVRFSSLDCQVRCRQNCGTNRGDQRPPGGLGYVRINNTRDYDNLPTPLKSYPSSTFTTSVTHQLHCLHSVVEMVAAYTSNQVDRLPEEGAFHLSHCLEYLRQSIMCCGDVALEGQQTTFPPGFLGSDGWDAKHVCRDYSQVLSHLETNRANDKLWI